MNMGRLGNFRFELSFWNLLVKVQKDSSPLQKVQ